jgi:hypothetical protein
VAVVNVSERHNTNITFNYLLIELNVIEDLQRQGEIAKEDVDTKEADDTEIA